MWEMIGTLSRWMLFTGLLTAIGAVAFRTLVLPRAGAGEPGVAFDPAASAARWGLKGVGLITLGALGRLGAQMADFRDPFESYGSELRLLAMDTSWGTAWRWQIALALIGVIAFTLAVRGSRPLRGVGWVAAAVAASLLAFTPAFSGHAAGSEHLRAVAISADVVHVAAGGAWLGTLAILAGVARSSRRSGHPVGRNRIIGWIEAFSPVALGSAVLIGATGVFGGWLHLSALSDLWAHPYGQRLSLKVGLLLVVLACGAYNWKRSRGRVEASGDPPRLPGTVVIELTAGLLLLLVTAFLVTTPPPTG